MDVRRFNVYFALIIGAALMCAPGTATAARHIVNPGESIQAAVDGADPGDTVLVMPGTYIETHGGQNAVTVSKDGIRLMGRVKASKPDEKVIIRPGPGNINGIVVLGTPEQYIQGSRVKGFTIEDFPNNGIIMRYVNKFRIEKNESARNLENGIWPILSSNGLVKRNVSYGSDDTALWVEDSTNVRVIRNVMHSSVTGIEVSQSDDTLIKRNVAYNNAAGIGIYMQPGRVRLETNGTKVVRNHVYDNNRPNSAPPGSMAAALPPGGGILLLGVDTSKIRANLIEDNGFYGIAIVDYCLIMDGTEYNCIDDPPAPGWDPVPHNNRSLRNTLTNNGNDPPDHPANAFAADIVVLAFGRSNCFKANTYDTHFAMMPPGDLPEC